MIIIIIKNCCYIDVVLLCYSVYDELHKWLRNNEESLIPATPGREIQVVLMITVLCQYYLPSEGPLTLQRC